MNEEWDDPVLNLVRRLPLAPVDPELPPEERVRLALRQAA